MKKIIALLLLVGIHLTYAQMPPVSAGDGDMSIPEIPEIPDIGSEPPTNVTTPPAARPTPPPSPSSSRSSASSLPSSYDAPSDTSAPEREVTIKADVPKDIGGAPVFNPAKNFMDNFRFEALFSSRAWWNHWWAPDMGIMRVTSLPQAIQVPQGIIMKWRRDSLGNPMAYLKAQLQFPRLKAPDATAAEQPLQSVPLTIAQAIVFYQRPGGWMASASPVYVTMMESDKKVILVPVQRGQAVWRAWVGHGGIYVENFVGAGLAAARTELNQYFRDEEIRLFTQGNSDVVFYLRPQGELAIKTASK